MEIQLRDSMIICVYNMGEKRPTQMLANSASLIAVFYQYLRCDVDTLGVF